MVFNGIKSVDDGWNVVPRAPSNDPSILSDVTNTELSATNGLELADCSNSESKLINRACLSFKKLACICKSLSDLLSKLIFPLFLVVGDLRRLMETLVADVVR